MARTTLTALAHDVAELRASVAQLAEVVGALAQAPAKAAPARGKAKSAAKVALVDTCACKATFRFGRTPADIAAAGSLCAAKGRTTHRNGGAAC